MEKTDINNLNRLLPLDEVDDLEVADHDPDVRGWEVYGLDGTKIGEVEQLIVNPAEMKVRYLDVELKEGVAELDNGNKNNDDRHILIPIGRATIDEDQDKVLVKGVMVSGLNDFPTYTGEISRDFEVHVLQTLDKNDPHYSSGNLQRNEDFYGCKDFDENEFYASRRKGSSVKGGSCSLRRRA